MPFASPYPVGSDVQPFCFFLIVLALLTNKLRFKASDFLITFFVFAGIFALYIHLDAPFDVRKRFGPMAAVLVVILYSSAMGKIKFNHIYWSLLFQVATIFFNLVFPDLFSSTLARFISRETYFSGDDRGAHGINAEPGGAAAVLVGHYFLLRYMAHGQKTNPGTYRLVWLLTLSGLAATKSGLGLLLSVVVVFHHLLHHPKDRTFVLLLLASAFATTYVLNKEALVAQRGLALATAMVTIGPTIVFLDGSIAERAIGFVYGVLSLVDNPFGVGGGGYPIAAAAVEAKFQLSSAFVSARDQIDATVSTAGLFLAEFGLIYIGFFIIVMVHFRPRCLEAVYPFAIAIGFLCFSFSFAFPVTWLLFQISKDLGKAVSK